MHQNFNKQRSRHRGMTFLELALVIGLMMALLSLLFIAARAWRVGSDRSTCIMNLRTVQMAVRSHQNMYGYGYGDSVNSSESSQEILVILRDLGYVSERLFAPASGDRPCPGGGIYSIAEPSIFPQQGTLFMTCSLAESRKHVPENYDSW